MKDELMKNFGQGTAPADPYPSAARPGDVNGLPQSGGDTRAVASWEDVPKFGSKENSGPPTSLPMTVPASSAVAESLRRTGNVLSPADRGEQ